MLTRGPYASVMMRGGWLCAVATPHKRRQRPASPGYLLPATQPAHQPPAAVVRRVHTGRPLQLLSCAAAASSSSGGAAPCRAVVEHCRALY